MIVVPPHLRQPGNVQPRLDGIEHDHSGRSLAERAHAAGTVAMPDPMQSYRVEVSLVVWGTEADAQATLRAVERLLVVDRRGISGLVSSVTEL